LGEFKKSVKINLGKEKARPCHSGRIRRKEKEKLRGKKKLRGGKEEGILKKDNKEKADWKFRAKPTNCWSPASGGTLRKLTK